MRKLPYAFSIVCLSVAALARPLLAVDQEKVNEAIDRGAKWVRTAQQADGAFRGKYADAYPEGPTALAVLALLKSGAPPNDPAIVRGLDFLRKSPLKRTYSVSLLALALEARSAPTPAELAKRKEKGEDPEAAARKTIRKRMPDADRALLGKCAEFLLAAQRGGMWAYPGWGEPDHSNAQFAALGLRAAIRAGAAVPRETWLPVAEHFVGCQAQDGPDVPSFPVPAADGPIQGMERGGGARGGAAEGGVATGLRETREPMKSRGWGYKPGDEVHGSMTCAALVCLIVAKQELEGTAMYEKKYASGVDRAVRDGCAWLAREFDPHENPGAGKYWLHYWLYSVERVGALAGVDALGEHDWYEEGATKLVKEQHPDGRWDPDVQGAEEGGDLVDSCFALLFLTRATSIRERVTTGVGGGGGGGDGAGDGGEKRVPQGFEGFGPGPKVGAREKDGTYEVTFRLRPGSDAVSQVAVAGSWNGWKADKDALAREGDEFVLTIKLPKGKHLYKFVLDGATWTGDPGNDRREPDGYGGENCILEIGM